MPNDETRQDIYEDLPLKVSLHKIEGVSREVETDIQIIFLLKGKVHIDINNNKYNLRETDIIFINNEDVYEISPEEENLLLTIKIDYDFFTRIIKKSQFLILCNSSVQDQSNENYDIIRKILSKIIHEYSKGENGYEIQIMSLLFQLIYLLKVKFLVTNNKSQYLEVKEDKYRERIDSAINYIKLNYQKHISLQDAANALFLTPEYLSRFFKDQTGTTFFKYLNEFRLNQAVKELIRSRNSVTKVAMNNGFPNLASFNKLFKEIYNITPSEYRNDIRKKQSKEEPNKKDSEEVSKIDYNQALEKLSKYVVTESFIGIKKQHSDLDDLVNVKADVNNQEIITHTWKNLINLGYAEDGLRSDLQLHLTEIQKHIKFKYVRFQGILGDDMLIEDKYDKDKEAYNFTKIDKLIDFLYSIGLRPFIELSNKAKVINRDSDSIIYFKYSSSKERSLEEWSHLLRKFIMHCVNRYGIDEVEQWYFELWKPGEIYHIQWNGSFEEYMNIFERCYNVIKEIVPNAKIGGPGINPEINLLWLNELLRRWKSIGVKPDFLSIVLYSYEFIEENNRKNSSKKKDEHSLTKALHVLSTDRNHNRSYLDKIKKVLKESEVKIQEVHVTEWNSSVSHRHPANDTTFKASFIAKNIIDNLGETCSLGYWLCSDISGELKDSKNLLYGDLGLVSVQGIKKPGFYVYEMLSRLGNTLIKKGEGYIITSRAKHNYEILIHNYKHFDDFFCLNEDISIGFDQYYSIFENQRDLKFFINLVGIKKGSYRIKKYMLNREHGSIFDEWLSMNAIRTLKQTEIEYLKQICVPKQTVWYEKDTEHLVIESKIMAHEVNLFEVSLEYN
jgi:xylan 1,4-beta-xylosidase